MNPGCAFDLVNGYGDIINKSKKGGGGFRPYHSDIFILLNHSPPRKGLNHPMSGIVHLIEGERVETGLDIRIFRRLTGFHDINEWPKHMKPKAPFP